MIKRNLKFKISYIAAVAMIMVLSTVFIGGRKVLAADIKQPAFAFGESLTEAEYEKTKELLGVKTDSREIEVMINELNDILHNSYSYHQVYSSVYLEPSDTAEGVSVEIVTPETITKITPAQYQNAAITAGAINLDIKIASVKAVDGSGALAGVYKAFSDADAELPEENIVVAQEELEETSDISEENEGKEGYSDELLNAAIAEIKAQIQKEKDENNGEITVVTITNIVNTVINNYNLDGVITEENKQRLISLMEKFSKLEFTDEQKTAIKDFGENLIEGGGKLMDDVKSTWDGLDEDVKTGISGFFRNFMDALADFFRGLFN
ncbi:DUF1002 domain-containing protein [Proteiniclasticum sp.]|uniref:DUF1002 domain-containing protein n=1 Tax=Proteiniclasticum sp. TaxID=2053595 RepID=UPI00289C9E80|nr:DUF1002 domain-containing protein [Proteiniclasticum sp.]